MKMKKKTKGNRIRREGREAVSREKKWASTNSFTRRLGMTGRSSGCEEAEGASENQSLEKIIAGKRKEKSAPAFVISEKGEGKTAM